MQSLCPSDLGLILSYKCQSSCAHCIYNCSSDWDAWMAQDEIRLALESTLLWQHPYQIHVTGGEPFLNYPLLLKAVEMSVGYRIPTYLETNAGWCGKKDLALERFRQLRQAGLMAVLISLSPFHAEAIPLHITLQGMLAAQEIFGLQRVLVYQQEWLHYMELFGKEHTVPLNKYVEMYGSAQAGYMLWQGYGLISGGRAGERLGNLAMNKPVNAFKGQSCRQEIQYAPHSHFDLYGNIIPGFCGGLSLGDWHELPLVREKLDRGNPSALVKILVESGPYGLYQLASQDFGFTPLESGYAGKCHLCVDVRRHLVETNEFIELRPVDFYRNF